MKLKFFPVALFGLFAVLSATAQTSSDLQAKYGKPLEAYEVRPNILLAVEYTTDGQILEAVIEPRHTEKQPENNSYSVTAFSSLSSEVVAEILDELIPSVERGKRLSQSSFNSSCNSIARELYQNVEINRAYKCSEIVKGSSALYAVRVRWRKR